MLPLLRDVLNRVRWHPIERSDSFSIVITDRVVPEGTRTLTASSIREVHASYFLYEENGELKHIPLHHVLSVVNDRTRATLWERRSRRSK